MLTGCGVQNVIENSKTESIDNASLRQLGDDAYDDQIWDDVVKYYTKLVKTSSNDSELWYRIGNAYNQLGQTNFAINSSIFEILSWLSLISISAIAFKFSINVKS